MRGAVGVLTRLPLRVVSERPGAAAFGLVGAVIGALAVAPLLIVGALGREPALGAVGAIASVAVLSGGFHLDGLADTADALLARDRDGAESARRDPRIGPGGAVALVLVLAGQIAALASLTTSAPLVAAATLVAVVSVSRVVPLAAGAVPVQRAGVGLGAWFTTHTTIRDALVAAGSSVAMMVGLVALLGARGWPVVAATAAAGVVGLAALRVIITWRGTVDGDALGAAVELSVVAGLTAAAIVVD